MNKVCVVLGPTATGKTEYGVKLAQKLGGEIVSADSMLVYRGMDIGTAKPSAQEMMGIPHHMIDIVAPDEEFNVAVYQKDAKRIISDILARGCVPILVGGTGLYINSITHNLDFSVANSNNALRDELNLIDTATLHQMLAREDPAAAKRIHPNNKKRVVRALIIAREGGSSEYNFNNVNKDYNFEFYGLCCERTALYERINKRVDKMMEKSLVSEVEQLFVKYGGTSTAMQGIGYKEIINYIVGRSTLNEAVEEIKKNTRHLAKRQITWFKRDERINWFDIGDLR